MGKEPKYNNAKDFFEQQREKIDQTINALNKLREYIEPGFHVNEKNIKDLYELYEQVKLMQGNFNNDIGHITTLMAEYWLKNNSKYKTMGNEWLKSQNSNGFDIDYIDGDERVVGEIKATIPANKNNTLGAQQWDSISTDLDHLTKGKKGKEKKGKGSEKPDPKPENRFMFVVDKNAFNDIKKRNESKTYHNFTLVLLGTNKFKTDNTNF